MKDQLFADLLESAKEAVGISKGLQPASRVFTFAPSQRCYTSGMVIELPTKTATRLENLRRSLGKSPVEALDFALKTVLDDLKAERNFRGPNPHAQGLSDADIMDIASQAVKEDRKKRRS